jgi:hypothetical protein
MNIGDGLAGVCVCRYNINDKIRMRREDAKELSPCIATATYDTDFHSLRIQADL